MTLLKTVLAHGGTLLASSAHAHDIDAEVQDGTLIWISATEVGITDRGINALWQEKHIPTPSQASRENLKICGDLSGATAPEIARERDKNQIRDIRNALKKLESLGLVSSDGQYPQRWYPTYAGQVWLTWEPSPERVIVGTKPQYRLLRLLVDRDQALTRAEIADALDVEVHNVSYTIMQSRRCGLIVIDDSAETWEITHRGRELVRLMDKYGVESIRFGREMELPLLDMIVDEGTILVDSVIGVFVSDGHRSDTVRRSISTLRDRHLAVMSETMIRATDLGKICLESLYEARTALAS